MANYNGLSPELQERIEEDRKNGWKNPYACNDKDLKIMISLICGGLFLSVIQRRFCITPTTPVTAIRLRFFLCIKMMISQEEPIMYNWWHV